MRQWIKYLCLIAVVLLSDKVVAQNVVFGASTISGCAPLNVTFTDSTVGANLWEWNFGEGSSAAFAVETTVSRIYSNPGVYTVTLTVNGTDSAKLDITVYENPHASFTVPSSIGCPPLVVNFEDQSTTTSGGLSEWFWNFGNGAISNEADPSMTFDQSGNYTIQLSVKDTNGCFDDTTLIDYITVNSSPTAAFDADNKVACEPPLTVNFTNQSTGAGTLSYEWILGDGTTSNDPNPTVNYTQETTYDVALIVNDDSGCPDTLLQEEFVGLTSMSAGVTNNFLLCSSSSSSFEFIDTSGPSPSSWSWTFQGGTPNISTSETPIITYNSPGTYSYDLLVTNDAGCSDQFFGTVVVESQPSVNFAVDDRNSCLKQHDVQFFNGSANASSYLWEFGDGDTSSLVAPNHSYFGTGNYNVSLTAFNSNGCSNTSTISNYITIQEPIANFVFDVSEGCVPLSVSFSNTSVMPPGEVLASTTWSFEGGTPLGSNSSNPSVIFNTVDSFDVQLIVETSSGCRDTLLARDTITAGDPPVIDFLVDPISACADSTIDFTNLSGNANEYEWQFGDGGSSQEEHPTHIYADTGYFDITLIAKNNGCPDTVEKVDQVYILPPIAMFQSNFDCDDPFNISFTDLSIDANTYFWDFGDGNTSTDVSPSHRYDTSGFVIAALTVTNGGCSNQQLGVVILGDPIAAFTADSLESCVPMDPNLVNGTIDGIIFNWEFGDGGTASGQEPSYVFQEPGIYDVKLIATAANGCQDSLIRNDYIEVLGADVDFEADTNLGCTPFTGNFTDLSSSPDGIVSWNWNFGDGNTSTIQNTSHTYQNVGFFSVSLEVEDVNGCLTSELKSVYMQSSSPILNLQTRDISECPDLPIQFLKTAFSEDSLFWDFGDGTLDSTDSPTHSYTSEGTYKVVLSAVDRNGCRAFDSTTVEISYPEVSISTLDSTSADCPQPPLTLQFIAGEDASNSTGSWEWSFGNGTGSSFQNPFASYSSVGDFDVSLKYTTDGGCSDSVIVNDLVNIGGPSAEINFPDTAGCAPLSVTFEVRTSSTTEYSWDFKDGTVLTFNTDTVIEHIFMSKGVRSPQLTLSNDACSWTMPITELIDVSVIPIDVQPDTAILCPEESINITVEIPDSITQDISSIEWFPKETLSSSNTPNTIASPLGSTRYNVIVTDQNGCIGPDTIWVLVDTIVAAIPPSTGFCPGDSVQILVDTSESNHFGGAFRFEWFPSNGLSSDTVIGPFADPVNQTIYNLVISDTICSDQATVEVTPYSNPNITVGEPSIGICYDQTDTISVSGASTFEWSPSNGLSDPTSNAPQVIPTELVGDKRDSTIVLYQVIGTDINNCKDTNLVSVKIRPLPFISAPNDTAVCYGDSVSITIDDNSNSYIWFPADRLNDNTGQTVTATPDIASTYNIIGVDVFGCKDTSESVVVGVIDLPQIEYGSAGPLLKGQTITLENEYGIGDFTYEWEASSEVSLSASPVIEITPEETTFYTISISTPTDPVCTVQDTLTVVVYDRVEVVTPTAFTPNGDGQNDELYAFVKGIDMSTFRFEIFNRWGQVVFETEDPLIGWNGFKDGVPLPMDTYVVFISGMSLIQEPVRYKMDVTLLR